ncbi:MAG: energy-coupling factor transporter transmembrane component T family protein [Methanobacterium sp.]
MRELDPRSKLLMVICISTLAIVYQDPQRLLCLLLFSSLILGWLGSDPIRSVQTLGKILPLLGLLFFLQCIFTRQGMPLLTVHGITLATNLGLNMGLGVILRIAIIIISGMILLSSSERDFLQGLVQWKIPYEIAFMVMLGLHFLPILREEALNVYHAVQMRGMELQKISARQKLKLYTRMMLPILSGALYRAEQMSIAMEARAFRAYPQRSYLRKLELKTLDYFVQISVVLLSIILLI